MAHKTIYEGLESSGKSLRIAWEVENIVERNSEWNKITGLSRPIISNLKFSKDFENYAKNKGVKIIYWTKLEELLKFSDCDLIIDEVSIYFDNRSWALLSIDIRMWLRQGAKNGIEMYGTAQNFDQVDKSFRDLVDNLIEVRKIAGSRRPSPTKPPIKRVWGICWYRRKNARRYDSEKGKFEGMGIPWFFFIMERHCNMYDTKQLIAKTPPPPMRHIERKCEICNIVKITHS